MPRTSDKRRHQRVKIDLPVEIVTGESQPPTAGTARDISLGGMFIETPDPAPFGASVQVRVVRPAGGKPLVFPATVRWTRPGGMGVQWGALGARQTHAITELERVRRLEAAHP